MKNWEFKEHWYLGFLALVGVWKLPAIWAYVTAGEGSAFVLISLLWFGWIFQLIPTRKSEEL